MKENQKNTDRANVLHTKQIKMEELSTGSTPIGIFITNNLMRNEPSYKQAGQESADRKEYLTGDKVKPVEQGSTSNGKSLIIAQ